jgi:glycosyltransferase involved in cell wall biosynthesis
VAIKRGAFPVTAQTYQINRQPHFGGGEVYTAFLCRALDRLGVATTLFVHPLAAYWGRLGLPASTRILRAANIDAVFAALPRGPAWLLCHGPLPQQLLSECDGGWLLTAVAHMPLQGRNPRSFDGHDMVFPVSGWVREGLVAAGAPVWQEPFYGVADIDNRPIAGNAAIHRQSRYDWDRRKLRDRALGCLQSLVDAFVAQPVWSARPGLTLGIVSRLTPIKQFPALFSRLAPVLARYPAVNLEIFGSGGYASVRDLDRALAPIADRVRFWGHQDDVRAAYAQLDYLITGLPEEEALGLNVIEAQACDLPVLAIKAPPFTETVADGLTGFFYRDPREDEGADFARLLDRLTALPAPLHPARAAEHAARFSFDAFVERLRPAVAWAAGELRQ